MRSNQWHLFFISICWKLLNNTKCSEDTLGVVRSGSNWRQLKCSCLKERAEVIFARIQKKAHRETWPSTRFYIPNCWGGADASLHIATALPLKELVQYDQLWIISYQSSHEDSTEPAALGTLRIVTPISHAPISVFEVVYMYI